MLATVFGLLVGAEEASNNQTIGENCTRYSIINSAVQPNCEPPNSLLDATLPIPLSIRCKGCSFSIRVRLHETGKDAFTQSRCSSPWIQEGSCFGLHGAVTELSSLQVRLSTHTCACMSAQLPAHDHTCVRIYIWKYVRQVLENRSACHGVISHRCDTSTSSGDAICHLQWSAPIREGVVHVYARENGRPFVSATLR